MAGRLVPPPLVESSVTRVLAASLTAEDAITEATRYDADAVLLWADKLTTMKEFKTWVDRSFVAVRAWAADGEATPTLYVRAELAERASGEVGDRSRDVFRACMCAGLKRAMCPPPPPWQAGRVRLRSAWP